MRLLLYLLAAYQGLNGLTMLAVPDLWYQLTPGASHTGPANTHFIRDIGLAFLAASGALLLAARVANPAVPILIATVFLGGHAALHLVEMVAHGTSLADAIRDFGLILVPAALPVLALRSAFCKTGEIS